MPVFKFRSIVKCSPLLTVSVINWCIAEPRSLPEDTSGPVWAICAVEAGTWCLRDEEYTGSRAKAVANSRQEVAKPRWKWQLGGRQLSCFTELINERSTQYYKLCILSTRGLIFRAFDSVLCLPYVCGSQIAKAFIDFKRPQCGSAQFVGIRLANILKLISSPCVNFHW